MADRYTRRQIAGSINSIVNQPGGRRLPKSLEDAWLQQIDADKRQERVLLGKAPASEYPRIDSVLAGGRGGAGIESLLRLNAMPGAPGSYNPNDPNNPPPTPPAEIMPEDFLDMGMDLAGSARETLGQAIGGNPLERAVDESGNYYPELIDQYRRRIVGSDRGISGQGGAVGAGEPVIDVGGGGPSADPTWDATKQLASDYLTREGSVRRAAAEAAGGAAPPAEDTGGAGMFDFLRGLGDWGGYPDDVSPEMRPPTDPRTAYNSPSEGRGRFGGVGLGSPPGAAPPTPEEVAAGEPPLLTPEEEALYLGGGDGTTSGASGGTATGALSLPDFLKQMEQYYPDLDFSNPKQAEADANARRDLDRTALLAQLQIAGGMLAGAGKSWEGLSKGFLGAAEQYDKGYQKYQNALQDSADRYGNEMKARQSYDLSRRGAALDLYMRASSEDRADRRASGTKKDRSFDLLKLKVEERRAARDDKRADKAAAVAIINKRFETMLEALPPVDPYDPDPEVGAKRDAIMKAWDASIRRGEPVTVVGSGY